MENIDNNKSSPVLATTNELLGEESGVESDVDALDVDSFEINILNILTSSLVLWNKQTFVNIKYEVNLGLERWTLLWYRV